MFVLVLASALTFQAPAASASQSERPRDVVNHARAAIRAGTVAAYRAAWEDSLRRHPGDRRAVFYLATLANYALDFPTANRHYRTLLQAPDSTDHYAIHAHVGLGWQTLGRESFDSTRKLADRTVLLSRIVADSEALVLGLAVQGFLASRDRGIQPSIEFFAEAERATPKGDIELGGLVACMRGPILSFSGAGQPMAEVERGIRLSKQVNDGWLLGVCYQSAISVLINISGDERVIEAYADSAVREQRASRDHFGLANTLFIQGYARLARSDIAGARRALQDGALESRTAGSVFASAWVHRFTGEIHWLANDLVTAEREYRTAAEEFDRLGDIFGTTGIHRRLGGLALDLGRVDEAEAMFRVGLARSEATQNVDGIYSNRLALAAVKMARRDWAGARSDALQAEAYGRAHGYAGWSGGMPYYLGLASLRLGELARAEQFLRQAIQVTGPTQYLDRYAARSRLAELYVRRGDVAAALRELSQASDQLDSLRENLDDRSLRLLVFQTRREYDESDLGFATIAAALVRNNHVTDVYRLGERRRAQVLADRLLRSQAFEGDTGRAPVVGRITSAVAGLSPRSLIPPGTALLEYYTGTGGQPTTLIITLANRQWGLVLEPIDSLQDEIVRFSTALEAGSYPAALGHRLREALLDSALALLPDSTVRLVIVPDGALYRLPFDAVTQANGEPLVARYALSQAPSADIAIALWQRPVESRETRILALGDPVFGPPAPGNVYRSAYEESGGLARLPLSASEARMAARFGQGSVLRLGPDANESFLKRTDLSSFRIIHFATHAMVDERSVARTSLALAPGDGDDGFLSPGELTALALSADLVVLSGCRTAGGVLVGGEGIQGLASALLEAGVRTVVATRWSVGDRETARLIEDFYREMSRGQPVDEALRRAKLAAKDRGVSAGHWAAFSVIGDPATRIPLRVATVISTWWIVAGGALVGLAAWLFARRRAKAS